MKLLTLILCTIVAYISLVQCDSSSESTPVTPPKKTSILFKRVPASDSHITHKAKPHQRDITGLLSGGGGIAAGDINNDGLPDLLFSGGFNNCKLYLNKGGLTFEDITLSAGVIDSAQNGAATEGVNLVDINGDGWLDIYILKSGLELDGSGKRFTKYGANLLYINQKNNRFIEKGAEYGLDIVGLSSAAQFFDYDNDGDLDVYITQTPEVGSAFSFSYYKKAPAHKWLNDQFLENIDGKRFVDRRQKAGILFERNLSLSASVADVNRDGWLDIYVANDFFGRDFLYINNGNKTFTESFSKFFSKTALSAMGADFADINGDGWMDLFVGEMMPESHYRRKTNLVPFSIEIYEKLTQQNQAQYTRNMLQLNQGGKRFRDIGFLAGVYATEWSWSSIFLDADGDGKQDLFVPNGIKKDMTNMDFVKNNIGSNYTEMANPKVRAKVNPQLAPSTTIPNYFFQNKGELNFQNMAASWGISEAVHTRGATYADLDNDGDWDLVLHNLETVPYIYENTSTEKETYHYLKVRLKGSRKNPFGIGGTVSVHTKGQSQTQYISNQRGFQSTPEPVLIFGLGASTQLDSLKVVWPGGKQQVLRSISVDTSLTLDETKSILPAKQKALPDTKTFVSKLPSSNIPYSHTESDYNDFKRERLLHKGYSRQGPAITTADINQDGLEDIYIGGAKGYAGMLYLQQSNGSFKPHQKEVWKQYKLCEEVAVLFFDANGDSYPDLYVGSGSNEFVEKNGLQDHLFLNDGKGNFAYDPQGLPTILQSTSAVIAGDFDKDGDLDLFVGANIVPGDYSKLPSQYILQNEEGRFVDITEKVAPELSNIGRVQDAIWTDYNQDQQLDLILVGEWMPIRILSKQGEKFQLLSSSNLQQSNGWWQSIAAADMDGDGDDDYVLGNYGLNSLFQASISQPLTLLTGDFDQNSVGDPILFHYTTDVNAPFVNRDIFCSQMPSFNNRFYTFEKYASATMDNLFASDQLQNSRKEYAYQLKTSYMENAGGGEFSIHALPPLAQLAPALDIELIDVNQDSYMDIILVGNLRENHYESGPIDASEGLVLLGNGKGKFEPIEGNKSGFHTPHFATSMAILKHSKSETNWIVVGNNNTQLSLFEWLK